MIALKSKNFTQEFSSNKQDLDDIEKFTTDALKRSKGAEDTWNIGYLFKF